MSFEVSELSAALLLDESFYVQSSDIFFFFSSFLKRHPWLGRYAVGYQDVNGGVRAMLRSVQAASWHESKKKYQRSISATLK